MLPTLNPCNPSLKKLVWAVPCSLATTKGMRKFIISPQEFLTALNGKEYKFSLFSVPPATEMFYFTGCASALADRLLCVNTIEFPHSEISGSKLASQLPEAYRRHATSFVASISQGIRHSLITYPSIYSTFEDIVDIIHHPSSFLR